VKNPIIYIKYFSIINYLFNSISVLAVRSYLDDDIYFISHNNRTNELQNQQIFCKINRLKSKNIQFQAILMNSFLPGQENLIAGRNQN